MSEKLYFEYKRMEPFAYPEMRDVRSQLFVQMCKKYKDTKVSKIPLSTEIILKTIKFKDTTKADKILLKYQVVILDWEETREMKDVIFNSKMFKWIKNEEVDYEGTNDAGGY